MRFEPGYLLGMVLQTIPEPRKIAREVQALRYPRAVLWQVFTLFAVLSVALGIGASMLFPVDEEMVGPLLSDPILMGIVETSSLVIAIFAIYWIGRAMGGTGRFDQAILTVIWLQFVMLLLQGVVLVLAVFATGLAVIFNAFGVALSFWILSHFITEMHGFRSAGLVFVMILVSILGLVVGLSIILAIIGAGAVSAGNT